MDKKILSRSIYLPVVELLIVLTMLTSLAVPFVTAAGTYKTARVTETSFTQIEGDVVMELNIFFGMKRGTLNETNGINFDSSKVSEFLSPYSEIFIPISILVLLGLMAESWRALDKKRRIEKNPSLFVLVKLLNLISVLLMLFQIWVINSNITNFNSKEYVGVVAFSEVNMQLNVSPLFTIFESLVVLLIVRDLILKKLVKR